MAVATNFPASIMDLSLYFRLTVRSVKFIRWLRVQLFIRPHHEPAIAALRQLYAVL